MEPIDVCVIGLGTVGLPLAAWFAKQGLRVHGVDHDASRVRRVAAGDVPTREPGLHDLVLEVTVAGRLRASREPVHARAYVIAVPTPIDAERRPMLHALHDAVDAIVPRLTDDTLVVVASTVPVGTTQAIATRIRAARGEAGTIHVAFAPERILPGAVLAELAESPRVVGGVDEAATARAASLYASLGAGEVSQTDARTAELCKLAENAQRDVAIAFADELASVAERLGVDAREVTRIANRHPRVHLLDATTGAGGPCLPKDAWLLAGAAPDDTRLVQEARKVAERRVRALVTRVLDASAGRRVIGCLGIAYKPDVDDTRGSTALEIVERLKRARPAGVLVADPVVTGRSDTVEVDELLARDAALVALVRHRLFVARREQLRGRVVVDACGLTSG